MTRGRRKRQGVEFGHIHIERQPLFFHGLWNSRRDYFGLATHLLACEGNRSVPCCALMPSTEGNYRLYLPPGMRPAPRGATLLLYFLHRLNQRGTLMPPTCGLTLLGAASLASTVKWAQEQGAPADTC